VQQLLALAGLALTFDTEEAPLAYVTDLLLHPLACAGQAAGRWRFGRRSTALQRGGGRGQAAPRGGHCVAETLGQLLEEVEGAQLMGHRATDGTDGLRSEGRAIGGEALERQATLGQRALQAPQKGREVRMRGSVIAHRRAHPLVLPLVDNRPHTGRPCRELIRCDIARKRRKRPVQTRAVHLPVGLFFPQTLPRSGGCQRAPTPGGRATSANARGDTARHLLPLHAPPPGSHGGWSDRPAGLKLQGLS